MAKTQNLFEQESINNNFSDIDDDEDDFNELANQGKLRPSLTSAYNTTSPPPSSLQQLQHQSAQQQYKEINNHESEREDGDDGEEEDDDDNNSVSETASNVSAISNESAKLDLLMQLDQLRSRGHIVREFNLRSNLMDMKKEEHRIKRSVQLTSSLKFQQKMLMAIVSGFEYMNKRFDPFSIDLDGWSENVFENMEDFNSVFERLFEKYRKRGEMAPELELMVTLAGSAFMFNMSNQLFKNMKGPSLNKQMKNIKETVRNAFQQQSAPSERQVPLNPINLNLFRPTQEHVPTIPIQPPNLNVFRPRQEENEQTNDSVRDLQLGLYERTENENQSMDIDRFSIASSTESIQEPPFNNDKKNTNAPLKKKLVKNNSKKKNIDTNQRTLVI